VSSLVTKYPVRSFVAITFVVSTIIFSLYSFIPESFLLVYFAVAMWVPGIVAIYIRKTQGVKVQPSLSLVWASNRFVWIAAITPFVLVMVTSALNILLTSSTYELNEFYVNAFNDLGVAEEFHIWVLLGQTLLNGFIAGITINTVFALGEEIGWRGFLQKELGYLGLWKSGLVIGLMWGFWHAPLVIQGYNFPQNPWIGVVLMTIACAPLGLIMSYFVQRSETVMSAGFFHGVFNAVAGLSMAIINDVTDFIHNPFGLTAILTYSLFALFLYLLERRRQLKIAS
jgi:membrane protease YdiL (CAAX protease family)